MTELRDHLDDLLAEVPAYVVPDVPAAWRDGARRRTRRRLGVAAAVVAAIAVVAGLTQVLPRAGDVPPAGEPGSIGYPAHVDKRWFLHDLPDRPGPISAVLETDVATWWAAAPGGGVWRVPQQDLSDSYPPALSDDGRMIGYLSDRSAYVLQNLVTGEETRFGRVTDNRTGNARSGAWLVDGQTPGFWSPDGTRVLVWGAKWVAGVHVHGLVLGVDGSLTEVKDPPRIPVGWLDDDTLVWLDGKRLATTDVTGRVQRSIPLAVSHRTLRGVNQWSAALSPDRTRLAIVLPNSTGTILTVSVQDGSVLSRENVGAADYCSPAWAGDEPAFFQENEIDTTSGRRTIVVDPAIRSTCILAAADALAGPRHERFGDRLFQDTWLSWHWQEVALGLLVALLLVAGGLALLIARSRRRSA